MKRLAGVSPAFGITNAVYRKKLFGLNVENAVCTFHKLLVCFQQVVVVRVVFAQNHACVNDVSIKIDSLCL